MCCYNRCYVIIDDIMYVLLLYMILCYNRCVVIIYVLLY